MSSYLEIRINDSGIGISAEFLPHVFERFSQADSSLTRRYDGLGLGLTIVKQLAELHGGRVRAESAGVGKGSSFIVELPVAVASGRLTTDSSSLKPAVHGKEDTSLVGLTILMVDDDLDMCELIKHTLTQCRASVIMVTSAVEGLKLLKKEKMDILISDIAMPEKDGYQFIREVRMLPTECGGKIPAIALTAFARTEDGVSALNAGFQRYLTKPVKAEELILTICSLIAR